MKIIYKKFITLFLALIITINYYFNINARVLITSHGTYKLNEYNVAIVGNSHASFMSDLIYIDNDLFSVSVGNHSVGGDDLEAFGNGVQITTDWAHGNIPIAEPYELKGWINNFFDDCVNIELAICWFGTNSLYKPINYFEDLYKNFINKVRQKSKECKLILMPIPYTNLEKPDHNLSNENIDKYNEVIKKIVNEYKGHNVFYEELPDDITYADKYHFDKDTFYKIWLSIVKKYNVKYKRINPIN